VAAVTAPALAKAVANLVAPEFAPGSVWLVGAGPVDPGLLTLHAAHALAVADVVLHDALVPAQILALASTPHCVSVGKRAGGARTPQLRINARLIALAR
jgi:uroporphyrin-III C-methyltransferase